MRRMWKMRKKILTFLVLLSVLFTGCILPMHALSPILETETATLSATEAVAIDYSDTVGWGGNHEFVLMNVATEMVVSIENASKSDGATVELAPYRSNALWQRWNLSLDENHNVVLQSSYHNKYLSVELPEYENFPPVISSTASTDSYFYLVENDDGTVSFWSQCSSYDMALAWDGVNFVHMIASDCDEQKFRLIAPGSVYNIQNKLSGKSLNPTAYNVADGTVICQFDYIPNDPAATQQFFLRYVGNEEYTIMDMHSGKLITAVYEPGQSYRIMRIQPAAGLAAQRFKLYFHDDGSVSFLTAASNY